MIENSTQQSGCMGEQDAKHPTSPNKPKRIRTKKEPPVTISMLNVKIEEKQREMETLQAEIEELTTKRNHLFFDQSELIGLIDFIADPESVEWLKAKLKESKNNRGKE